MPKPPRNTLSRPGSIRKLISQANARCKVMVGNSVERRSCRRESKRAWIVQSLRAVERLTVSSFRRRVEFPAQPVSDRQTTRDFPSVLGVGRKICEHHANLVLGLDQD